MSWMNATGQQRLLPPRSMQNELGDDVPTVASIRATPPPPAQSPPAVSFGQPRALSLGQLKAVSLGQPRASVGSAGSGAGQKGQLEAMRVEPDIAALHASIAARVAESASAAESTRQDTALTGAFGSSASSAPAQVVDYVAFSTTTRYLPERLTLREPRHLFHTWNYAPHMAARFRSWQASYPERDRSRPGFKCEQGTTGMWTTGLVG